MDTVTHTSTHTRSSRNHPCRSHLLRLVDTNIKEEYGYADDELLKSTDVAAYYFNPTADGKVNVEELGVNNYGFDVQSINAAIEEQNSVINDLYDQLIYDNILATPSTASRHTMG